MANLLKRLREWWSKRKQRTEDRAYKAGFCYAAGEMIYADEHRGRGATYSLINRMHERIDESPRDPFHLGMVAAIAYTRTLLNLPDEDVTGL